MGHIFLYGPPGTGKTTVGRRLAASLQMPFIDLDQAIDDNMGMSIPQLVTECGENGFRDIEAQVLRAQVGAQEAIIALGGGTLLRAENRRLVESHGMVICLRAELQVLLQRLVADPNPRPLLAGSIEEKLRGLLTARAAHYGSFSTQVNADQAIETLTEELQNRAGRFHLSAMGDYDVLIEDGGIQRMGRLLKTRGVRRPIIVADENVAELYANDLANTLQESGYEAATLIIPNGEASKRLTTVEYLWRGFLEAGLDRGSTVVALGGGVVGDVAGFAASTFMRGINWVCVPTTLVAMVDASIGGKTGFDFPEAKNLIGSFHAPRLVLVDSEALGTLPDAEFRNGLAEVVKHGIIADEKLFDLCDNGLAQVQENLPEIVRRAIAVKVRIVEADPHEKGTRAALNFGHTVGHAVEVVSQFGIRHGEAVAMGMIVEARLAEHLGIARSDVSKRIAATLCDLELPISIPQELSREQLIRAMWNDKKRANGVVRFALPVDIGQVHINVEVANLESLFEEG